jgi:hypothetical protein
VGPAKTSVIFADTRTYQVARTIDYFPTASQATPITANYSWTPRSLAMVTLINHPRSRPVSLASPSATDSWRGKAVRRPGMRRRTGLPVPALAERRGGLG